MSAMIGIIKSHKGSLQLSSKLGAGTTFKVYFPLPAKADTGELIEAPVSETAGTWSAGNSINRTILLVDDEEELRSTGASMLVAMGFTVITAPNGREALEIFSDAGSAIDLILMDLTMPEMDGIEAYHELRKIASTVPILFCSGYGNDPVSLHITADLHADSVSKPYNPNEVRKILTRLLAMPR
jgi:CheY-like chemotaxis protein